MSQKMKDLIINLQTKTKVQQETNSTSNSNKYNTKTMQEETKLNIFGLSENQAAIESPSIDFVDRYQNNNFYLKK